MGEIILSPIAGTLLSVLQDKLFDVFAAPWISKTELRKFEATVFTIRAVLLDAEEKQFHSANVKRWLERLSLVLYDADDLFDDYSTEYARRRAAAAKDGNKEGVVCLSWVTSVLSPIFEEFLYARKVNRDIKVINEKLDDISKYREEFQLEVRTPTDEQVLLPSWTETESGPTAVVGRGDELEKLMGALLTYESGKRLSIISVIGIGGIGKTTLARQLFDHETIIQHFELRVWVHIGDNFDVRWIVRRIVESTTGQKLEMLEPYEWARMLLRSMGGRRYLLVLDDVWSEDPRHWGSLLDLLKLGGAGSKVLVTTRSEEVATAAGSEMVNLRGLTHEASLSLFNQVVFDGEEPRDAEVRDLGRRIAENCDGIPLVIKIIGRLLAVRDPKTEWLPFVDEIWRAEHHTDDDILRVLRRSYQQLPSYLKPCFEYCSLFPKDSEIEVWTLIHLWIAQGFVKHSEAEQEKSIEDVGYSYSLELLGRSFLQEAKKDEFGEVRTVRIHNLMHALASSVAGSKSSTLGRTEAHNELISEEVRHLTFSSHLDASIEVPPTVIGAKSLRTIFLANQELRSSRKIRQRRSILNDFCSGFARLRALDVHNSGIEQVPPSIGYMRSLRYLDLSENDDIKLLPDSIAELWYLQVLKLSDCERLKQLPINIGRLLNLRHLHCEGCWNLTHMPRSIGELTSLITLTWFVLPKRPSASHLLAAGLSELGRLNHLKGRLEIRNLGAYMKIFGGSELESASFFKEKKGLRSLSLFWDPNLDEETVRNTFIGVSIIILDRIIIIMVSRDLVQLGYSLGFSSISYIYVLWVYVIISQEEY